MGTRDPVESDAGLYRSVLRAVLLTAAAAAFVSGCAAAASPSPSAGAGGSATAGGASPAAEAWCTEHAGHLVDRVATWNTNGDPKTWLELAGLMRLCEFEMTAGDAPTRISVDLATLSSEEPTLAGLAYLSKVRTTQPPNPGQNPATWSCATDLGGASSFGNAAAGSGGWVDAKQPIFVVMNLCVFADGSAIDAFGLWFHANGFVRGADLAPLMRYQPGDRLPGVFDPHRIGG